MKKIASKISRFDAVFGIACIVVSLVLWWPTRYLPYHWDSAGFVINAAYELVNTNFSPLIAKYSDFSQPPLFIILLALLWKFFGNSPLLFHTFMYAFLPMLQISTYKFFDALQKNKLVSIGAALMVSATPVVVAEYGNIYQDLPAASLAMLSLALWVRKKHLPGAIALSFAVLTKISILFLLPLFLLMPKPPSSPKDLASSPTRLLVLPVFLVLIYFAYHYQVMGWVFIKESRQTIQAQSLADFIDSIQFVFSRLMLTQGRWMIIAGFVSAIIVYFPKKGLKSVISYPMSVIFAQLLLTISMFAWTGEFAERYGIFLLPLAYGLILWVIHRITRKKSSWFLPLLIVASLVSLVVNWYPTSTASRNFSFRPPSDLRYQDTIIVHRKAAKYLESLYPGAQIFGSFPENIYLTQPYQNYVVNPLDVVLCKDFTYQLDRDQILYIHPTSPGQVDCKLVFEQLNTSFLQRYSQNETWVELYLVVDPSDVAAQNDES